MGRVDIDWNAVEELAKSGAMRELVHGVAEDVASGVKGLGILVEGVPGDIPLPVKVYDDTTTGLRTNRAVSRVVLAHASGLAVQAKHGALSKAASAAGLKLKGD